MIKITGIDSTIRNLKEQVNREINSKKIAKMDSIIKDLKDATPVDTGKARDGWRREGNTIVNDVEYIDELNQGTSQQASSFFVERTVLAHRDVVFSGIIVKNT
jgi:hypothetical protein